jgi:hypothetical protein
MADIERSKHGQPRNQKQVLEIIRLRDKGYTWRMLGGKFGMSHMGAKLLYEKWKPWSRKYG